MKNEGAWINASTGHFELIDEHARWIVQEHNANRIGLTQSVYEKIRALNWINDRLRILVAAMDDGLIRFRAHSLTECTFEFTMDSKKAMATISAFVKQSGLIGETATVKIHNLRDLAGATAGYRSILRDSHRILEALERSKGSLRLNYPKEELEAILG